MNQNIYLRIIIFFLLIYNAFCFPTSTLNLVLPNRDFIFEDFI